MWCDALIDMTMMTMTSSWCTPETLWDCLGLLVNTPMVMDQRNFFYLFLYFLVKSGLSCKSRLLAQGVQSVWHRDSWGFFSRCVLRQAMAELCVVDGWRDLVFSDYKGQCFHWCDDDVDWFIHWCDVMMRWCGDHYHHNHVMHKLMQHHQYMMMMTMMMPKLNFNLI